MALRVKVPRTLIEPLPGPPDYRMTLRYTEITRETVGKEYRAALTQLETR